ncbi:hypothetical protein H4R34_000106 [Dimargaris verticillata]|uniref:C2H2-type domain-containing protein n=1 Tax=Dimargaris verticillata TaxID=2761393 RepID=A0A9W8EFQ0_9FUNG|nr:hypothetical protein H4R34_000106 [Dimargaris verticillata]
MPIKPVTRTLDQLVQTLPLQWPVPGLPNVFGTLQPEDVEAFRSRLARLATAPTASPQFPSSPQRPGATVVSTRSPRINYCEPCQKAFKNEATWQAHLSSTRHLQFSAQASPETDQQDIARGQDPTLHAEPLTRYADLAAEVLEPLQTLRRIEGLIRRSPDKAIAVLWNLAQVLWTHRCIRDTLAALNRLAKLMNLNTSTSSHTTADHTALRIKAQKARLRILLLFGPQLSGEWLGCEILQTLTTDYELDANALIKCCSWALKISVPELMVVCCNLVLDENHSLPMLLIKQHKLWDFLDDLGILILRKTTHSEQAWSTDLEPLGLVCWAHTLQL